MRSIETPSGQVEIPAGSLTLHGQLHVPPAVRGVVLFALGSGSSQHSARNQRVAESLHDVGLATLRFDLLTPPEERSGAFNAHVRFNVGLLAERLAIATDWTTGQPELARLPLGYFGASIGAAAALVAATERTDVSAVVTRGGRPEAALATVQNLRVPTLLIVGGKDEALATANLEAWARMRCEKSIEIIPGASRLFEEPGALDNVAALATRWFSEHFRDPDTFNR